jgi:hypothetical protein
MYHDCSNQAAPPTLSAFDVHHAVERNDIPRTMESQSAAELARSAPHIAVRSGRLPHRFPEDSGFDRHIQRAEREFLACSRSAQTALAENYVGLPQSLCQKSRSLIISKKAAFEFDTCRSARPAGRGQIAP